MSLAAEQDVAMVLPIPVPPSSGENAVRFVDMSSCPSFFGHLDALFPEELTRSFGGGLLGVAPQPAALVVHNVGDFEASFVPTRRDFDRLDERFRLQGNVWDALPAYADWGFCVFKLRAKGAKVAPPLSEVARTPGLLDRVLGIFDRAEPAPASPPAAREYHPMAFEFPRRDPGQLFLPTVHVHDGAVHATAHFDHTLYCQVAGQAADWRRSSAPAGILQGGARAWVDPMERMHRLEMIGDLPNRDVFVAAVAAD